MDTNIRRPWRGRAVTLGALVALLAMLLPAVAGVALAHIPSASFRCVSDTPTLQVDLTSYNSGYTNKVSVTIDGVNDATYFNYSFGTDFHQSWTPSPSTSSHAATVVVLAGDDLSYTKGWSQKYSLTVPACVSPASPTITTQTGGSVVLGSSAKLTDTATLSGGSDPTGTITFELYDPTSARRDTETATVSGNGSYPTPTGYLPDMAGTWHWVASYGGDSNNNPVASGETDEPVVVEPASPTLPTVPSAGGPIGTVLNDTATVSGGSNPTGTITFSLYGPDNLTCSGTPIYSQNLPLSGASAATAPGFTTVAAGTYEWTAFYSGDANNSGASSGCRTEEVVVGKSGPTIVTTLSSSSVPAGTAVHDSATLIGATANASGTVTYVVYTNSGCTAGAQGAGTLPVVNHAVPDSNPITFNSAGIWFWQAVYSGDANNAGATSACTQEILVVTATPSPSQSFQGATATPVQSCQCVTATPQQSFLGQTGVPATLTPAPTSSVDGPIGSTTTPLVALMICLSFAGIGLMAVGAQRMRM